MSQASSASVRAGVSQNHAQLFGVKKVAMIDIGSDAFGSAEGVPA